MKPTETLARATAPDGAALLLTRRDGVYRLSLAGQELMTSRQHGSERELARLACAVIAGRPAPRVLIGGLGLGYTLRAALEELPPAAEVVVCEVFAFLLDAHREAPADLAGRELADPRVTAVEADVQRLLGGEQRFDAIVLDVDNGPWAFTLASNAELYSDAGLARLHRSLNPAGVLAVWSAGPAPDFERRLRRSGFAVRTERAAARTGARRRHTLFIAQR